MEHIPVLTYKYKIFSYIPSLKFNLFQSLSLSETQLHYSIAKVQNITVDQYGCKQYNFPYSQMK